MFGGLVWAEEQLYFEDVFVLQPSSPSLSNLIRSHLGEGVQPTVVESMPQKLACSRVCKIFHKITNEFLYEVTVTKGGRWRVLRMVLIISVDPVRYQPSSPHHLALGDPTYRPLAIHQQILSD